MLRSMCGKDAGVKDYCRALTISGQKSEIGDGDRRSVARTQNSPVRTPKPHSYPEIRNDSDFLIMPPSIRPISAHFPVKACQLTHKMGCVTPLCPCFSKVQADRSR